MLGKMNRLAMVAALGMIATGCGSPQRTRIGVRGDVLLAHRDALYRDASADLPTVVLPAGGSATQGDRETVFLNQSVVYQDQPTTLDKLLDGCVPQAPATCRLAAHAQDVVILRSYAPTHEPQHDDGKAANTAFGVITLAGSAVGGVCLSVCDSNKGVLVGAAFGTALIAGLLWAITSGAHD